MSYITAHGRQKPTYVDDASSAGGRSEPNNETTASLKSLVATLNFIDFWLKHFQHNYQEILIIYHDAMIEFLKQIPTIYSIVLT